MEKKLPNEDLLLPDGGAASRRIFLGGLGLSVLSACSGVATSGLPFARGYSSTVCPQSVSSSCGAGGELPSNLSGLTLSQIQAITTEQIAALTGSQIGTLTNNQSAVLTAQQCGTFHGSQALAVLSRVTAAQSGRSSPPPSGTNPPPPPYTRHIPAVGSGLGWAGSRGALLVVL